MTNRHPDQLPLFWLCHVCGYPGAHPACHRALDRWFRSENRDEWIDEPNRAAL